MARISLSNIASTIQGAVQNLARQVSALPQLSGQRQQTQQSQAAWANVLARVAASRPVAPVPATRPTSPVIGKSSPSVPPGGGPVSPQPDYGVTTDGVSLYPTEVPGVFSNKSLEEQYQDRMRALLAKYEGVLAEKPSEKGLAPEEKKLYEEERGQLKARYEAALGGLRRQQEKEKGRLLGRYAATGFSEPGAIGGPLASEPGIVTKALQETGEQQKRELANLEQAQAGDLLAIAKAEAEAERREKAEGAEQFEKRQQAMLRNLEKQLEFAKPEEFTIGNRLFARDRVTGKIKDITPSAVGWETKTDDEGNVYRVNAATGEFQKMGKVAKKTLKNSDDAKRDSQVRTLLSGQKDADGLVSADSYLAALQEWIRLSGAQNDFFALFPQATWMKKEERKKFDQFIGKKSSGSLPGEEEL